MLGKTNAVQSHLNGPLDEMRGLQVIVVRIFAVAVKVYNHRPVSGVALLQPFVQCCGIRGWLETLLPDFPYRR